MARGWGALPIRHDYSQLDAKRSGDYLSSRINIIVRSWNRGRWDVLHRLRDEMEILGSSNYNTHLSFVLQIKPRLTRMSQGRYSAYLPVKQANVLKPSASWELQYSCPGTYKWYKLRFKSFGHLQLYLAMVIFQGRNEDFLIADSIFVPASDH